MATEVEKALNIVEHIALTLKKTQVNLKKSPKSRLTRNNLETRLKCVEDYWSDYKIAYSDIIRLTPREQREQVPYIAKDVFYEHEDLYICLKTELKDLLTPLLLETSITASTSANFSVPITSDSQVTRVVLPKIQIPTYSGQYEEWLSFHDLFTTLVHNNKSLDNVQKLHYLKTSLTGEAASILKHIQVTDCNYNQAWDLLKSRYGNKRITINAIMKRFFSQKKMTINTSNQIKHLMDTTFECLHHLKNLKVQTEGWDPLIIFVVVQKLDSETHKDWEEHVSNSCQDPEGLPTLEMLRKFLESRFRTLELIEPTKQKPNPTSIREKSFHIATNIESAKKCQMCTENHTISHCKEFGRQTPTQRSEYIKTNNLCFNCLAPGHSVRQCRIPTCCRLCRRRHHTLLHETKNVESKTTGNIELNKQPDVALHTNVKEETETDLTMLASHVATQQSAALLATALIQVTSEDNNTVTLRALIDQGSQASFISERAAQLIKAKRYPIKGTVVGVGSTREDIKQVVQITIESKCEAFNVGVKAYIIMSKQMMTNIPSHTINVSDWPHLVGLRLADPSYFKPGSIDVLLGVEVYAQIIQNQLIKGPPGSPCAHKTNLGWILLGKVEDTQPQQSVVVMHHQIIVEDFLKTLWEVDQDLKRKYTTEEGQCEKLYDNSYTRNKDGRYVVSLPFKTNDPKSPNGNTREIAMQRLLQQEKRLDKTPELREEYNEVLEEYLTLGHMEQVPDDEMNNRSVYLPYHA